MLSQDPEHTDEATGRLLVQLVHDARRVVDAAMAAIGPGDDAADYAFEALMASRPRPRRRALSKGRR